MNDNINLTDLRRNMDAAFSMDQMKLLVADLNQDLQDRGSPYRLDWDNIKGDSKMINI